MLQSMNESGDLSPLNADPKTCWDVILLNSDNRWLSSYVAIGALAVVSFVNLVSSVWCAVVMLTTPKLQKPTWLFKGSMAIKDILLNTTMLCYGVLTVVPGTERVLPLKFFAKNGSFIDPVEFAFNVVHVTCISASFMHLLLICLDRHQVISRPFRYHTGDLLPTKVARVLIASIWTFSFVIGLSVSSESLESAERSGRLITTGTFFPMYATPDVQKWLMGGGMALVFGVTCGLIAAALHIEYKRARTRKAELLSGNGAPEPLRSRNNSLCHNSNKGRALYARDSIDNSESDANEFLLRGGAFGFSGRDFAGLRPISKPWATLAADDEATFFTPVHYRPSLLRRIRDTWSLYCAAMCFCAFALTTVAPFIAISLSNNAAGTSLPTFGGCVANMVGELLFVGQGICYVTLYLITDDVFRPFYTGPLRLCSCPTRKGDRTAVEGKVDDFRRGSENISSAPAQEVS